MSKKSGSGSRINNLDHIFESLETIFWVKILKFFDGGSGMEKIGIRDKHLGSATLICSSVVDPVRSAYVCQILIRIAGLPIRFRICVHSRKFQRTVQNIEKF
jgi:hypothetical protein